MTTTYHFIYVNLVFEAVYKYHMNNLNENLALDDFRISKYIHGFHVGFIKEAYDISGLRVVGQPPQFNLYLLFCTFLLCS